MDNSLKSYLQENLRVDESLTLLAIGLIAFAARPMLKQFGEKAGEGVGEFFGGLADFFGLSKKAREEKERKRREKEKEAREKEKEDREWEKTKREWEKEDHEREEKEKQDRLNKESLEENDAEKEQAAMANILNVAEENATKPEDKETIDLIRSSAVDKNGDPIPINKMGERMEELTGKDPQEVLGDRGVKPMDEKESEKYQKAIVDKVGKLSPEERQKIANDGLKKSKELSASIQKHKDETKKLENDLEEAKKSGDEAKIKAAQEALQKHNDNATGVAATVTKITNKDNSTENKPKEDPNKGVDGEPEGTTAKEEDVTDKETGEKVKRKVYTGPRGGRYYYPNKSPHKPENKVYVESLSSHLIKNL